MGYFKIYNTVGRHFMSNRASSILLTKIVPEYVVSPIQTTYPARVNLLKIEIFYTGSLIV
jgi:hypothetical protein